MIDFFVALIVYSVIAIIVGISWAFSASTIASECQKLGAFYVGSTVYECKIKESKQ
jgi:hypothetical protein